MQITVPIWSTEVHCNRGQNQKHHEKITIFNLKFADQQIIGAATVTLSICKTSSKLNQCVERGGY